jgi:SLIT-ROBO Rho GTPase activating protein
VSGEEALHKSRQKCVDGMNQCISNLDPRTDKQAFIESNSTTFNLPRKFEFFPHRGDDVSHFQSDKTIRDELDLRHNQLRDRLESLRLENDELWKTMETAEKTLMGLICVKVVSTIRQMINGK